MRNADDLLTTTEVADQYRVTRTTVGRWVKAGQLVGIRLPGGRSLRFRRSDVDALADNTTETVAASPASTGEGEAS